MELSLVSAGDDIKVWDCSSFTLAHQYNPHNQNVSCTCWSTDNGLLGSVSVHASTIELLSMKSMTSTSLDCQTGCLCIDFNDTSRYMLSGGSDGVIAVWDLKSKKIRKTYKDHKGPVTCARFNYNSSSIASGSETGEIIIYNVVTGQGSRPMTNSNLQAIKQIQYNRHKKSLLGSVSDDGGVNLWDCNTRQLVHHSGCHRAPATGLSFSPINNIFLMTVGLDKRVVCHDVQSKTVVKTMDADSPLTSIDTMQDGVTVVVGSTRGKIYQYDLRMGSIPFRTIDAHKSSVQTLKFQLEPQSEIMENNKNTANKSKGIRSRQLPLSPSGKPQGNDFSNNRYTSSSLHNSDNQSNGSNITEDVFSPLREGFPEPVSASDTKLDYRGSGASLGTSRKDTGEGYAGGVFSPLNDNNLGRSLGTSPLALGQPFSQLTPVGRETHRISAEPAASAFSFNSFNDQVAGSSGLFLAHPDGPADEMDQHSSSLQKSAHSHIDVHIHEAPDHIPVSIRDPTLSSVSFGLTPQQQSGSSRDNYYLGKDTPNNLSLHQVNTSQKQVAFAQEEESDPYAFLTATSSDSNASNSPEMKRQRQTEQEKVGVSASPNFPSMQLDDSPTGGVSASHSVRTDLSLTPEGVNAESAFPNHRPSAQVSQPTAVSSRPTGTQDKGNVPVAGHEDMRSLIRTVVQEEFGAMKKQMVTMIRDEIEDRTDQLHSDIINLQAEMLRMFQIQQAELSSLIQHYSVNQDLVSEVVTLREELKHLKKNF